MGEQAEADAVGMEELLVAFPLHEASGGDPRTAKLQGDISRLLGAPWNVIDDAIRCGEPRRFFDLTVLPWELRQYMSSEIFVEYQRLIDLRDKIAECHISFGSREPKCAYICGDTGAGKSRLKESYAAIRPRVEGPEGAIVPILSMTITPTATIRSLSTSLLAELRDPHWEKGSKAVLFQRVKMLVRACRVELLFLDEFQHLVDSRTDRIINEVADWVKTLIVETRIPVVAFGQRAAGRIFEEPKYEQLGRRFPIREEITPFTIDSKRGYAEFATFLHAIDTALPLGQMSGLSGPTMVTPIWKGTGGVVSYVMDLIKDACQNAVLGRREAITQRDLSMAFTSAIKTRKPSTKNPF